MVKGQSCWCPFSLDDPYVCVHLVCLILFLISPNRFGYFTSNNIFFYQEEKDKKRKSYEEERRLI